MNFYDFHIGDYASRTGHLEPMEDLAYRRMLDLYYVREAHLPIEVSEIARLTRLRGQEAVIKTVLAEFFTLTDNEDGWEHDRCEAVIAAAQDKRMKAKASADKRWDSERNANAMPTHSDRTPKAKPTVSEGNAPSPSPIPSPIPKKKTGAVALLLEKGIPESLASDFAAARAAKHAPLTATALEGIEREAKKAGMSLEAVLRECCTRGWQSFKAQWMVDVGRKGGSAPSSDEWFDSRSCVEAKAGEFGIKPWVETEEQWPAYRQRVMKAAKGSSEGFLSLDQLLAIAPERKAA